MISPSELFKDMVEVNIDADLIPGGAMVGSPTDAQKDSGCIAITEDGQPKQELYLPLVHVRFKVLCTARMLDLAERQGRACFEAFNLRNRTVVTQASTDEDFLVHYTSIMAGPSAVKGDGEHWVSALFIYAMIGTDPIT